MEQIKKELTDIRDTYGDERQTSIEAAIDFIDDEDLIEEEQCVFTMTNFGYIKRLPADTYKAQHRGGRGISGLQTREEDFVKDMFTASTHDFLLFFTNRGRVYKLKGYHIPEAGRQAKGSAIINLLPIEKDEKVSAMIPLRDFSGDRYLTMLTKNGIIKKTALNEYDTARKGGLLAIVMDVDDELIDVQLTSGSEDLIIGTHNGLVIRFNETDARPLGRVTRGVRAIMLKKDDYVVGMAKASPQAKLMVVTENGYGKKTSFDLFKTQHRGGMGLIGYKTSEKTGKISGITEVTQGDDIMLITSEGVIIRMFAEEITTLGRATQGVRLMRPAPGVKVIGLTKAEHDDMEETTAPEETAPEGEIEQTDEA